MRIRAAVAREKGAEFAIEELTLDDPRPDEVLVEVSAVGICHTDVAVRDQWLPVPLPAVLGHEGAGVVRAVGAAVTTIAPGDQVVMTYWHCGRCRYCRAGHPAYCDQHTAWTTGGSRADGSNALHDDSGDVHGFFFSQSSFATHAIATERNVVRVPEGTDPRVAGPLGCGIQTGAGTVLNRLRPRAGSGLAVFGAGAVGLAAVMAARLAGCSTIIAVDVKTPRLDLAADVGATHTIDASTGEDVVGAIRDITSGGADFSVETSAVPAVAAQAVDSLAKRGTCAILGLGPAGTRLSTDMTGLLTSGRTSRA
jgi:aryl-alcohol dehydrogenase